MERVYVDREEPSEFPSIDSYVRCLLDIVLRLEEENPDGLARLTRDEVSDSEAA